MNDKKAAKKIIRIAKTRPDLYSKADVVYARIIKKRIKERSRKGRSYPNHRIWSIRNDQTKNSREPT